MSDITTVTVWDAERGAETVDLTEAQQGMVRDFQTTVAIALDRRLRAFQAALEATGLDHGAADELLHEAVSKILEYGTVDYLPRD